MFVPDGETVPIPSKNTPNAGRNDYLHQTSQSLDQEEGVLCHQNMEMSVLRAGEVSRPGAHAKPALVERATARGRMMPGSCRHRDARQKHSRRLVVTCAFLLGVVFLPTMRAIGGSFRHGKTYGVSGEGEAHLGVHRRAGEGERPTDWENAPRVDLVCRSHAPDLPIMWENFFPSYLLFWPIRAWKSSGLIVILDGDSLADRQQGTILQNLNLSPMIRVKYEAPAPKGTLCSNWRRTGYARQQWSNFYGDLYSDADYVAIFDADTAFQTPVVPSDLFEEGKPIVVGFNQESMWNSEVTARAVGGHKGVGRFMTVYSFPVVVRTSDFPKIRAGITRNLGVATFEEAFHLICSVGPHSYSQFEIIFNYMWYNMRDGYAWHIAAPDSGQFRGITGENKSSATDEQAVLSKNIPTIVVMIHTKKAVDDSIGPSDTFRNLCVGSNFKAGFCKSEEPTAKDGVTITGEWTVGNVSWSDTNQEHLRRVMSARPAFDWRPDVPEDWLSPGGR